MTWGVFCKKSGKWGCVVKKVENGGGVFVKSGPFLNAGCVMYSISIFLFYILLIWGAGCVGTQRTSLSTGLMYSNASILGGQTELN